MEAGKPNLKDAAMKDRMRDLDLAAVEQLVIFKQQGKDLSEYLGKYMLFDQALSHL
jgi:hypothetical protein